MQTDETAQTAQTAQTEQPSHYTYVGGAHRRRARTDAEHAKAMLDVLIPPRPAPEPRAPSGLTREVEDEFRAVRYMGRWGR